MPKKNKPIKEESKKRKKRRSAKREREEQEAKERENEGYDAFFTRESHTPTDPEADGYSSYLQNGIIHIH